ncbi:unnamed protein product [Caenorhabditis sp. 36 PRJEB53466]|nr:unnamed protein product [Caenorhabditis sp. 36 PRJEB53466]
MSEKQQQMQDFLNRKRKMDLEVAKNSSTSSEKEPKEVEARTEKDAEKKKKESEQFERAKKALLFEAGRAKDRAGEMGPQGYVKPKSLATNKQFLRRTIESTLPRRKGKETKDPK